MAQKLPTDGVVGLDIGHSHISAVRLRERDGQLVPVAIGEIGLPAGVISPEGAVLKPAQITKALKALWAQNKFKSNKVVLNVTASLLSFQPMMRGRVSEDELRQSVELEMAQHLPYPSNQAQIGLAIVAEQPEAQVVKVLAVSVHSETLRSYIRACQAANLQVIDAEPEVWALPRAVDVGHGDDPELLLDIGMHASMATLVIKGRVQYCYPLYTMGADNFTRAIIDCGYEPAEAERWKREHSLIASTAMDDFPTERAALRQCTEKFIEALYQVITLDATGQQPTRLVLTGGGARLSGLASFLNESLGLPVERAIPVDGLDIGAEQTFPRTALAFALAMRAFPEWRASSTQSPLDEPEEDLTTPQEEVIVSPMITALREQAGGSES